MKQRDVPVAVVLALVAALVVAPVAAAAAPGGAAVAFAQEETETPADDVQPGEKLSGVVGVQQAELEGEVDERTFGVKMARANTDSAKADVVADQLDDAEARLEELEQRKRTLEEARENGSITEGEYRAKMAKVAAETENVKRMVNASEREAGDLPADLLADKGVDAEAIQTLRDRAGNLSGPEVAEIAKSIAGEDTGKSMGRDARPSGDHPPVDNPPNGTDEDPGPPGGTGGPPNGTDDA